MCFCGAINIFTPAVNDNKAQNPDRKTVICPYCGAISNISSASNTVKCALCGNCFVPDAPAPIVKGNVQAVERIRETELSAGRDNGINRDQQLMREQLALEKKRIKIDKKRLKLEKKMAKKNAAMLSVQSESIGSSIAKSAASSITRGLIKKILK